MRKKIHAFSLVEMMIVVAIIGIVGAMAYPSYTSYFLHQRRLAAKTALFQLASALENYFNVHESYQRASLETLGLPAQVASNQYLLQIQSLSDTGYVIAAQPVNAQQADTLCGTLSLTSTGEKHSAGSGELGDCW